MTHFNEIQKYYEQTRVDYSMLWQGSAKAIHFGYWTENIQTHNQSLLEMNRQLAQAGRITAADTVLDAGCGVGGSSCWLAATIGCRVTGINITPFQIDQARAAAARRGLDARVNFECQDYGRTTFADQSFSIVWFLESLVHSHDKGAVLAESYRVLKPGGRLILADYILPANLPPEQKERMRGWWEGWAMAPLDDLPTYQRFIADARFTNIQIRDISREVQPSLRRVWVMSKSVALGARILHQLRIFPRYRYSNIHASIVQYETFADHLWQYQLITATKP